jgi:hypothetical protein
MLQNYILTPFQRNNIKSPATAITLPPLLVSFTVVSDHLSVGEVPLGCGPWFGTALVRILISFRSRVAQGAGGMVGSQLGLLSCCF